MKKSKKHNKLGVKFLASVLSTIILLPGSAPCASVANAKEVKSGNSVVRKIKDVGSRANEFAKRGWIKISTWIKNHPKTTIAIGTVVVLAIVGTVGFVCYKSNKGKKEKERLEAAKKAAEEAARKAAEEEAARKAAEEEAAKKAAEEEARKAAEEEAARKAEEAAEELKEKPVAEAAEEAAKKVAEEKAARKPSKKAARKAANKGVDCCIELSENTDAIEFFEGRRIVKSSEEADVLIKGFGDIMKTLVAAEKGAQQLLEGLEEGSERYEKRLGGLRMLQENIANCRRGIKALHDAKQKFTDTSYSVPEGGILIQFPEIN